MPVNLGNTPPLISEMMKGAQVHPTGSDSKLLFANEVRSRGGVVVVGFLRHFSCIKCKEKARDWSDNLSPKLSELGSDVSLIIVGNGTIEQSVNFANEFQWPAINLFTDPELNTYRSLSFAQGFLSITGIIWSFLRGAYPINHLQLGGVVIVDAEGYVRYFHRERYAGDHADLDELVRYVKIAETPYDPDSMN